ncbi:MAG TPA: restriction endonuclease [Terrisporobacter glycolicus]|uniref:hypothetical protein n=1 Tax=Terrisporobacter TaxID=1505652 RepID=UPI000E91CF40|nr:MULTISPECIES: hypothetical protein [Terrisporobacter]HBI93671.1 restriction endonuclease [Terrisporobacter hibernicus]
MKLDKIADISTGLVLARKKSSNNKGFAYELLTLKSFNENGYIEDEYLDDFISEEKIKSQYLTQEGDIVVRLSSPNTAVYITKQYENMVIPSLFAIIRNKSNSINTQFIQIYLNSEICKRRLATDTIGSAVSIVKTSTFKEIKIPEYTIEKQEKIIKLNKIMIKEKILLNKLVDEKNKYHKIIMSKMFK